MREFAPSTLHSTTTAILERHPDITQLWSCACVIAQPPTFASCFSFTPQVVRSVVHQFFVRAPSIVSSSFSSTSMLAVLSPLAHARVLFFAMYQVVLLIFLPVWRDFQLLLWV